MHPSTSDVTFVKVLYLRILPNMFHYLKFILEGYDNLAILSSWNMKQGVVRLRYPSCLESELYGVLAAIAPKLHTPPLSTSGGGR